MSFNQNTERVIALISQFKSWFLSEQVSSIYLALEELPGLMYGSNWIPNTSIRGRIPSSLDDVSIIQACLRDGSIHIGSPSESSWEAPTDDVYFEDYHLIKYRLLTVDVLGSDQYPADFDKLFSDLKKGVEDEDYGVYCESLRPLEYFLGIGEYAWDTNTETYPDVPKQTLLELKLSNYQTTVYPEYQTWGGDDMIKWRRQPEFIQDWLRNN